MTEDRKSFFEDFLEDENLVNLLANDLKQRSINKIFSWMNNSNEKQLAKHLNLETAWDCPETVLKEQFNKIYFKRKLKTLGLPISQGFECSTLEKELDFFNLEK